MGGFLYYVVNVKCQIIRKPGSVLANHLSSLGVAPEIERIMMISSGGKPRTKLSE